MLVEFNFVMSIILFLISVIIGFASFIIGLIDGKVEILGRGAALIGVALLIVWYNCIINGLHDRVVFYEKNITAEQSFDYDKFLKRQKFQNDRRFNIEQSRK